jgi:hypothetical protein
MKKRICKICERLRCKNASGMECLNHALLKTAKRFDFIAKKRYELLFTEPELSAMSPVERMNMARAQARRQIGNSS